MVLTVLDLLFMFFWLLFDGFAEYLYACYVLEYYDFHGPGEATAVACFMRTYFHLLGIVLVEFIPEMLGYG